MKLNKAVAKKTQLSSAEVEYQKQLFANFNQLKSSEQFLSNQAFLNQFFLENNLSGTKGAFNELYQSAIAALEAKNEVQFKHFTLSFTRDPRFSLEELVLDIAPMPNPRLQTISLVASSQGELKVLLDAFNALLDKLLHQGYCVEVFKDIILSSDSATNKTSVFFSQEVLNAHQKNQG